MADGADLSIDGEKLARDGDRLVRQYLAAGTRAVGSATKQLERDLEAATRAAVGGKLWRAWKSNVSPPGGKPARNPDGIVFVAGKEKSRERGAMTFFTRPGAIRGREGQWLAIPLPAAGPRGRKNMLTPVEWQAAHNIELEYVPRPGKWPLLVAQQGNLTRGGTVGRRSQKRAVADIGRASVRSIPIFVLVPMVKFRNSVAVEPLVQRAAGRLPAEYLAEVGKVG